MFKFIGRQFDKLNWFFKNYRAVQKDAQLIPTIKSVNYHSDGMIVFNNCDCLTEEKFVEAYQESLMVNDWRGIDGKKFDMRWRYYIVCSIAMQVRNLEGDFVECGVYKGGYAKAVMNYISFNKTEKTFWLFDTYEGLSIEHLTDKEIAAGLHSEYAHYENSYDQVMNLFKNDNVQIIKGTVPETLDQYSGAKIAYLSIDMNCVEPEIAAAEYFWPKMVSGAVMILDDYGFKFHLEQKKAFDQFAASKNVSILQLPTGQGILFKP